MEGISNQEHMRSEEEAVALIDRAILDVVEAFEGEMIPRDREMLVSVTKESTDPLARVIYLKQIVGAAGVSENMKGYVNQVLQTLRQGFTEKEQERFRGIGKNVLEDLN